MDSHKVKTDNHPPALTKIGRCGLIEYPTEMGHLCPDEGRESSQHNKGHDEDVSWGLWNGTRSFPLSELVPESHLFVFCSGLNEVLAKLRVAEIVRIICGELQDWGSKDRRRVDEKQRL